MSDTHTFLDFLFRDGEIFEIRLKSEDDEYATKTFFTKTPKRVTGLVERSLPVWEHAGKHVWVGVCPRPAVNNSAALHGRVLWVDLSEDVDTVAKAEAAVTMSGLPDPTMIVWSGNGVHLYWKLDREYPPEELAPHARAVHEMLPSDATHDPTRVMRLPGTFNPKHGGKRKCLIVRHTEDTYELSEFPKQDPKMLVGGAPVESRDKIPLKPRDRQTLVDNFTPGQRHYMTLAIAGYLRKELAYTEEQARLELASISQAAGSPPDDKLENDVRDTYAKPWARVAGTSALYEMGIQLESHPQPKFHPPARRKPKGPVISIIDPNEDITPQEFWVPGLIGPGLKTLWAAPGKTGKSFAVMQIGHAIATGSDLWDFGPTVQKRVLYFQGELTRNMVMERATNLFGDDLVRDFRQFAMTDKPDEPISLIRNPEILADAATNYDVVIVDPIAAFNDNDENSAGGVRDTIAVFDPLVAAGKAVVIVHHTRKVEEGNANFADVRGSGAWFNAVDAMAVQFRLKNSINTQVKFGFRAAPDRDPLTLYRMHHGGFTHDWDTYNATVKLDKLKFKIDPNDL